MSSAHLIPKLCNTTAHKIAIHVLIKCNDNGFQNSTEWHHYQKHYKEQRTKISALPIPREMIELIQRAMKAVECEIRQNYLWIGEIWTKPSLGLYRICWTSMNKIDVRETIKSFLFDETFKITDRYELACNYKIEDAIPVLWNQLSELDHQWYFHWLDNRRPISFIGTEEVALEGYNYVAHVRQCPDYELSRILHCLTEYYPGHSLAECLAIISLRTILRSSSVAFFYFWEKLSQEEKDRIIIPLCCDVIQALHAWMKMKQLNFLLTQLNDSQQRQVIEMFPQQMATVFFCCTSVRKFSEVNLQHLWRMTDYMRLLRGEDFRFFKDYCNDEDFYELFTQIWHIIPAEEKDLIKSYPWSLAKSLLKQEMFSSVRFLLSQAEEKLKLKEFASSVDFQECFTCLFIPNHVEFLHEILSKCLKLSLRQIQIITRKVLLLDDIPLNTSTFSPEGLNNLERFLNFVFLSKKKVAWFKFHLLYKHGKEHFSHYLEYHGLKCIDKLLEWGFGSQEEIANFRKSLLNSSDILFAIFEVVCCNCQDDSYSNFYEPNSRDQFPRKCLESDEEISGSEVVGHYGDCLHELINTGHKGERCRKARFRRLLKWFNPAGVYFAAFLEKLESCIEEELYLEFLEVLDEFNLPFPTSVQYVKQNIVNVPHDNFF